MNINNSELTAKFTLSSDGFPPQLENAAHRLSYQGSLSLSGIRQFRKEALQSLPADTALLHQDGMIHIHDLEALGRAPNCLVIDLKRCLPIESLRSHSAPGRILSLFEFLKYTITSIANEQSGGISFGNIDDDLAWAFEQLDIEYSALTRELVDVCIRSFIDWINKTRTRYGLECYYVTMNLGLSTLPIGRFVTSCILDAMRYAHHSFIRPNIVFKVRQEVNLALCSPNRDLFDTALATTAERMVPTYLLCDSSPNINVDAERLAIVGCRTRIAANEHGPPTAIGRGNLAYLTINLPRLAWQAVCGMRKGDQIETKITSFIALWNEMAIKAAEVLLLRSRLLEKLPASFFPGHLSVDPWLIPFASKDMVNVWHHGTLSIGFVGLAETVELLSGLKYGIDSAAESVAWKILSSMRKTIDDFRSSYRCNFTLLGTSAEMAAGRFAKKDWETYGIEAAKKGFYTNSFHVPVDVSLGPIEKLRIEGQFHTLCNGGGISYVEFSGPPQTNILAIEDLVTAGIKFGVSYLGINFPRDVCQSCGEIGIFDNCTICGSADIKRFRRVSGYLEEVGSFTSGKRAEVARRLPHADVRLLCQ